MTMSFVSCHDEPVPPDPDAGQIPFERDGGLDGHVASTGDALAGDATPDAGAATDAPDTPVG